MKIIKTFKHGKDLSHKFSTKLRAVAAIGISLALTFWGFFTPAISQGTTDQPSANLLYGPKISHGPELKPINLDVDLHNLPSHAESVNKKVFPRPLRIKPVGPVPVGNPSLGSPLYEPVISQSASMPSPSTSFKGLDFTNWGSGWPPDPVGDVGPNHYVQAVNTSIGIFDKTGARLTAFTYDSFWSGANSGTACDANNQGDPTVIYDPLAGRWIFADFAFTGDGSTGPYYECIAVSKTADPVNGGWWLYPVRTDDTNHPWFADYPKMGIWPDGLYMTANMFDLSSINPFQEVRVWAFNRADLESGATLRNVIIDLNSQNYFSLLPSNLRGSPPPVGRENILVSLASSGSAIDVFKFHVDYTGGSSTFSIPPVVVSLTKYNTAANTVPTPGNPVDSIGDRLMMQAQYRNFGGVESVWVNHTVQVSPSGPAGIQWAQINVSGGTIATTPVQQQIFGPNDNLGRWLGSLAVDNRGNMALGYSAANSTVNPDIRYSGRLVTDTLNTLPQGEVSLLQGITRGTQSGTCGPSTCTRWGDYSAMTLDPDGCTFWYTNEYYEPTILSTNLNWQTRIGSFKYPSCTSLVLKKTASTATYDHVGQIITYTYTITNSSLTSMPNPINITDDKLGTISNCGTAPLAAGAHTGCVTPYTITQANLDAGSITNRATANTTISSSVQTSALSIVTVTAIQNPGLSLLVTPSRTTYDQVGDVITYTYKITNIGNVTLPGPFMITDNKLNPPSPCGIGPLAPASPTSCTTAYHITQADFDSGSVSNSATVSTTYNSKSVVSKSANQVVILARIKIDLPIIINK